MVRRMAVLAAALLCCAAAAGAVDRIGFEKPLFDANDRELAALFPPLLERTAAALERLHGAALAPAAAGRGDYALAMVAVLDQGSLTLTATLRRLRDGVEAPPLVWVAPPGDDLPLYLARGIFARWSVLRGVAAPSAEPPVLVDEVATEDIRQNLSPLGIAALPGGEIAVTMGTACLELDGAFRVVAEPGKELAERGNLTYAGFVSATPGGTLILRPSMGKDLYRVAPGGGPAQRMPLGLDVTQVLHAALPDGSALVIDFVKRRALRVQADRRQELPLFTGPNTFIYAFAAAPDGSLWIWDQVLGGVRIHTADGVVADYVLPLVEPAGSLVAMSIVVGPGGDFLLFSNGQLLRFRRDGTPVWRLDRLAGAEVEDLPQAPGLAVDWQRGLIYLADPVGRRILKLLDRSGGGAGPAADPLVAKLAALHAGRPADDPAVLAERARLYEEAGSFTVAMAAWRRVLDADPGNTEADRKLTVLELAQLKTAAAELEARARTTLQTVGIENARPIYQQALAKYELVLSRAPGDAETAHRVQDLKQLFSDPAATRRPGLGILEAKVDDLFPSLMSRYRQQAVGTVTVKNLSTSVVENLRASLAIAGFTDAPVESKPVASLAAGATAAIELQVALSQKVLENDEDLPVSAVVTVAGTAGGVESTATRAVSVVLHRRTALTWDVIGRIAAFITPNEETVSGFAARLSDVGAAEKRWQLSSRFPRAVRICEGIGAAGIAYVEDPDAPISKVLGSPTMIDTVRFARDTLARRAGDCDDTTVLLASALESAGIRTAVLTTPGHIFLAFDSGEPAENAALLATSSLAVMARDGAAWVPVETTVLKDGFLAAWTVASGLVRRYADRDLGFSAVRDLRASWPALALPRSTIAAAEPAPATVSSRFDASLAAVEGAVYTARVAELEKQATGMAGRQALKVRLQQGILHALFGRTKEAERVFTAAIQEDPTLSSPYVNLANLKILAGDLDAAISVLRTGLAKNPSSPLLNLAAARCFAERGDVKNASDSLAKVKAVSPELGARYEYLAGGSEGGSGRAAQAGVREPALWAIGEEK